MYQYHPDTIILYVCQSVDFYFSLVSVSTETLSALSERISLQPFRISRNGVVSSVHMRFFCLTLFFGCHLSSSSLYYSISHSYFSVSETWQDPRECLDHSTVFLCPQTQTSFLTWYLLSLFHFVAGVGILSMLLLRLSLCPCSLYVDS